MAYILKSDLVVNDPNGEFNYLTPLGLATKELAEYYNSMELAGYDLSQSEFNALKSYQENLMTIGQWDNIMEFAPLIGNTIDQVSIKLKAKNNIVCSKNEDITDDWVDGKGLFFETRPASYPKALNMLYTTQDTIDAGGAGVIAYFKRTGVFPGVGQYETVVGGVGGLNENYSAVGTIRNQYLNSTMASTDIGDGPFIYVSKYSISGNDIIGRKTFKDGVQFSFSDTPVTITTPANPTRSHFIGATDNQVRGLYGFEGFIRLAIIHNGQIPDAVIPQVSNLTNQLITDLGKTLV